MNFLLRRIVHGVLLLVGVSLLSFLFFQAAPGDYFADARVDPRISPETVAQLRAQYGLDRPLGERYARWVHSAASGEFGFSLAYNTPVSTLLWPRVQNTLMLTVCALLLAWPLALVIGIWSATRAGRWDDRLSTGATSALLALPEMLIAVALLYLALRTHLLPVGDISSGSSSNGNPAAWRDVRDRLLHLALPVTALVLAALPVLVRHVRAAMIEALRAPYVRAAMGHGIGGLRLLLRHALPAAANPLIALFGLSIATLLSGSLLVEIVLGWPGLGPLVLEAVLARDVFVVLGAVMLSTVLLIAGSLVADVLLLAADPRVRVRA
jgi:peptide/nickel transport system permease protein